MRRMESSRADMSQGIRIPENGYSEQSIQFMDKVMEISGLGDKTFLPDGVPFSPECPFDFQYHLALFRITHEVAWLCLEAKLCAPFLVPL